MERSDSESGKGVAKRRAAQAQRGSLGRLLVGARGQRPIRRLVYRIRARQRTEFQGRALRGRNRPRWGWVAEDTGNIGGWRQGRRTFPPKTDVYWKRESNLTTDVPQTGLSKIDKC